MQTRRFQFLCLSLLVCLLMPVASCAQSTINAAWSEDERLNQKISVTYRGGPMNELLARLAKENNVEMSAAKSVQDDLIVLMVSDQPLSAILQKIATHFNFEWERTGEKPNYRYRLIQTQKAAEEDQKKSDARSEPAIKLRLMRERAERQIKRLSVPKAIALKEMEKHLKALAAETDIEKKWAHYLEVVDYQGVFSPSARLVLSLMKTFTPQDWKQASTQQGITFSTHPWGTERQLPSELLALVKPATDEQSWFTQKIDDAPSTVEKNKPSGFKIRFAPGKYSTQFNAPFEIKGTLFNGAEKAMLWPAFMFDVTDLFSIDRQWFEGRPDLEKLMPENKSFDSFFSEEDETESSLGQYEPWTGCCSGYSYMHRVDAQLKKQIEAEKAVAKKFPADNPIFATKITFPKEMTQWLGWSSLKFNEEEGDTAEAEASRLFADFDLDRWFIQGVQELDKRDPLDWGYAPLLKNVHEQAKLNVLSDGFDLYPGIPTVDKFRLASATDRAKSLLRTQTLAEILNSFSDDYEIDSKLDGGWLSLRNRSYVELRKAQVPRSILRKWIKPIVNENRLTLDELAEFATDIQSYQWDDQETLLDYLLMMERGEFLPLDLHARSELIFYFALTPAQKQAARSEKGLLPSEMSASQQVQYKTLLQQRLETTGIASYLIDPITNADPEDLKLTIHRGAVPGYRMTQTYKNQLTPYVDLMPEEEYERRKKQDKLQEDSPHSRFFQAHYEKGELALEVLEIAPEFQLSPSAIVAFFQPAPNSKPTETPAEPEVKEESAP